MSVTVETVDEDDDDDDDDSLAAASVPINADDIVQNCENDTSISLDIPCESGGVFSFDDPNFDRDNPDNSRSVRHRSKSFLHQSEASAARLQTI